ncbi:cytochrome P450 [Xylaria sp. FL0043]|nr:cytochrome P450 [Xylaria sp. FL0043]
MASLRLLSQLDGYSLVGAATLPLLIFLLGQFLYQGFCIRRFFYKLRVQGIPIMEPHSMFFGHLRAMKELKVGLPKDAHPAYTNLLIVRDWKKHFPTASNCPPVVYLDLWPFFPQPFILLVSPESCSQVTQETPQPRHPMFKWGLSPVTDGKDLISMSSESLDTHRLWRSRLSPGLSLRGLLSDITPILEEVEIFARTLKALAGHNGQWGEIFSVYEKTMNLTYDVIARVTLDLRLHEQTKGRSDFMRSFYNLTPLAKFNSVKNRLERFTPKYRQTVATNSKVLRDAILPGIEKCLASAPDAKTTTVISLALDDVVYSSQDSRKLPINEELLDILVSQTKFILFAGGDVVGLTLAWVLYEIFKYPSVIAELRAEHDRVFGPDAAAVGEILRKQPYKVNELRYTNAVIKEALRLHSPSQTLRQGNSNFNIVVDATVFPTSGCLMQTSAGSIHRREDVFPRPTEFLPERFLVQEGDPLHPPKNAYRPFEMGNMRCIGDELALIEMRLALLYIVRELDLQFDWDGWDKLQGRTGSPGMVFGERGYQCGSDVGHVKDGLPTRVRLQKGTRHSA